jgi:hypothetical protein
MTAKFRLACAAMVSNESDIVESFARHNLAFVDHLHVLFHNSYDSSRQIIERLVAEGLPISFETASDRAFRRERLGDALIRQVVDRDRYDYLMPLDADEFIVADSREALEAELAATRDGSTLAIAWLSFVPTERDDERDPNPLTRIRHRLRKPHPKVRKVFFASAFLKHPDIYLADGNHHLLSKDGREIPERPTSRIFLAHYPIRSAQQFVSKVAIGAIARQLSADYTDHQSQHWRSLAADPGLNVDMSMRQLTRYAVTYLGDGEESDLIEAPLPTSARTLRYPDLVRVDAFGRLVAFVSGLLEAGALSADRASLGKAAAAMSAARAAHQDLLMEVEQARRTMQHLHQNVRQVRRKARTRLLIGIGGAALLSVGLVALVLLVG